MFRYAIALGLIAVVAASAWWLDLNSHAPAQRTPPQELPGAIYAAGRVEGVRPETNLRPWEHGRVMQILVREGQAVEANQALLILDDDLHRHEVALAAAEVARAKAELDKLTNGARAEEKAEAAAQYQARLAQLDQARRTWQRTQSLHADGVVSHQQADDDRTRLVRLEAEVAAAKARMQLIAAPARVDELRAAQARVAAAQTQLDLAELHLQRRQLRAPFAGRVLEINVEPGEMSGPQSLDAAVVIADTSRLRVRAYVEELEAPLIQVGMPAKVSADGLPGAVFAGRVAAVSPRMGPKNIWTDAPSERFDTKTREVWIDLDAGDGLLVGLRVHAIMQRKIAPPAGTSSSAAAQVSPTQPAHATGG